MDIKLYITVDHNGFELKNQIIKALSDSEINTVDLIEKYDPADDYPITGGILAEALADQPEAFGLAICGTGQGICMSLNRFNHVRAGITTDLETVKKLRQHNHANVLCLPASVDLDQAIKLIQAFLNQSIDTAERHVKRVQQLGALS